MLDGVCLAEPFLPSWLVPVLRVKKKEGASKLTQLVKVCKILQKERMTGGRTE